MISPKSLIVSLTLLFSLQACVSTEDQVPAQEMLSIIGENKATSLPPEATDGLDAEKVTRMVEKDKVNAEGLTPDDIEADNDPMKIGFETARWNLSDIAQTRIQNVAEQLKVDDDLSLKIDGHCDERGTDQYNQILSEKRAKAVRDALVSLGIKPSRLTVEGFGRRKAAMKGQGEKVYSHNRRVEMIFSKSGNED